MSESEAVTQPTWVSRVWWGLLPSGVSRASPDTALALSDGVHVTHWPAVGEVGPPLMFILGLLLGWSHPGFPAFWSQSVVFMALVGAVGTMSAALGAYLVAGFAVGDFFLAHSDATALAHNAAPNVFAPHDQTLRLRVPLILGYCLLGLLAVRIPMLAKALTFQLPIRQAWTQRGRLAAALLGHAIVTLTVVWFWIQAVPVLIRPVFTWTGGLAPPTEAVNPLQQHGATVVTVAVASSVARMLHQFPLAFDAKAQAWFDTVQAPLQRRPFLAKPPSMPRKCVRALVRGGFTTFLAVGIFADLFEAVVLFATTTVLYLALAGIVPIPLGSWPRLACRIPVVLRLIGGVLAVRAGAAWLLHNPVTLGGPKDLFRPFVVATLFSLVVVYLLAAPSHAASAGGSEEDDQTDDEDQPERR